MAMWLAPRISNLEFGGMIYLHRTWQFFPYVMNFPLIIVIIYITVSPEWLINLSTAYYIKIRNDIKTELRNKCPVKRFEKYFSSTSILSRAEICHAPHNTLKRPEMFHGSDAVIVPMGGQAHWLA